MSSYRTYGILVGVFYIVASAAGVVGLSLTGALNESDYLTAVARDETSVTLGALLVLVMGVAVAGVAVSAYPVLRTRNPGVAVGYVAVRTAEGVLILGQTLLMLALVWVGKEYLAAQPAPDGSLQTAGDVLLAANDVIGYMVVPVIFPLGALLFYSALYQRRLVPRWLSGWGLAAAALWLGGGLLMMFGAVEPESGTQVALAAPIGIQEMVLAVWLIVRGFREPVAEAGEEGEIPLPGDGAVIVS